MRRLALGVVLVVAMAGCGSRNGRQDAPVKAADDSGADVVNMPDQFPNVAHKCLGRVGIYVTTRQQGINTVIVADDSNCPG